MDWFNKADDAYRSQFRELFATHFQRFDAKLEKETARLEIRLIRWMFLFWLGTVGTMIALLRFWNL